MQKCVSDFLNNEYIRVQEKAIKKGWNFNPG